MTRLADPNTPLTGSSSIVSFAASRISMAAFSAEISFDRSPERREFNLNMLARIVF